MLQSTDLRCWLGWKIQFQAAQNILCFMIYMDGGGSHYKSFLSGPFTFQVNMLWLRMAHFSFPCCEEPTHDVGWVGKLGSKQHNKMFGVFDRPFTFQVNMLWLRMGHFSFPCCAEPTHDVGWVGKLSSKQHNKTFGVPWLIASMYMVLD